MKRAIYGRSGHTCCVTGCSNNDMRNREVSWHKFPADKELRDQWIAQVNQAAPYDRSSWEPKRSNKICGIHFNLSGRKKYEDKIPKFFPPHSAASGIAAPYSGSVFVENASDHDVTGLGAGLSLALVSVSFFEGARDADRPPIAASLASGVRQQRHARSTAFLASAALLFFTLECEGIFSETISLSPCFFLGDGGAHSKEFSTRLEATKDLLFKCCFCAHVARHQRGIISHLAVHGDENGLECQQCQMYFSGKEDLKRHHCPQAFALSSTLKVHIEMHKNERLHKCPECPKAFNRKTHLNRHIRLNSHLRILTGEKPYQCHLCPQAFSVRNSLKVHIRTHTNERPYRCPHCSKAFTQCSNMTRHIKAHTNERP
ncbi:unnamed protein product, partial [Ixodes hexagonus]